MKKHYQIKTMTLLGFIILLFPFLMILLTRYFENMLVQMEIDKLQTLAKNNIENIKYYFDSKLLEMEYLFDNPNLDTKAIQQIITNHSTPQEQLELLTTFESGEDRARITTWIPIEQDYVLQIEKPLENQTVRLSIQLSSVYEEFLSKVNLGENGYCALKDEFGVIVMHYAKSQIGVDSLQGRLDLFPELDPKGVNHLLYNQYNQDNGCDIVNSYWWDRPEEGKVKKLVSYASAEIDGHRFVGTIVMDYNEVVRPLKSFIAVSIGLTACLILVFSVLLISWQKEKRNTEKLKIELEYTKNLNQLNQKFEQQKQQIQKYDKLQTLGVLSGSVAHEYNNLLTPALIYTDLLAEEALTEEARQLLLTIRQSLVSCGEFSNQLKDYVKQDVMDETSEKIELKEVLKTHLFLIERIKPARIMMTCDLCEEPIWIMGNKRAIGQILLNLFNNSFQAIQQKGLVTLSLHKEGKMAVLSLQDNGQGMDGSTLEKIYTPFFTTKSENEGTGLGLSVVKNLLKNMNGFIQCESELGKETKFTIRIPILDNYE